MLLREAKKYASALHSRDTALAYLGSRFRVVLDMPASLSDIEAGQALLDRYVLVHIPRDAGREKFDVLVLMLRKLYGFVRGDVLEDNADSLANQEMLLSGHLIQMVLKEKLHEMLVGVQMAIAAQDAIALRAARGGRESASAAPVNAHDGSYFRKVRLIPCFYVPLFGLLAIALTSLVAIAGCGTAACRWSKGVLPSRHRKSYLVYRPRSNADVWFYCRV